ncbi:MAG: hypothetical protein QOD31_515, partial [Pseudonocardiales bacterium]|nr:hypothetical protein [Pseudonocardiales bacterium]
INVRCIFTSAEGSSASLIRTPRRQLSPKDLRRRNPRDCGHSPVRGVARLLHGADFSVAAGPKMRPSRRTSGQPRNRAADENSEDRLVPATTTPAEKWSTESQTQGTGGDGPQRRFLQSSASSLSSTDGTDTNGWPIVRPGRRSSTSSSATLRKRIRLRLRRGLARVRRCAARGRGRSWCAGFARRSSWLPRLSRCRRRAARSTAATRCHR